MIVEFYISFLLDFVFFEGSFYGFRVVFEVYVLLCGIEIVNELLSGD